MQRTSLVPIALFSSVLLASATAADDTCDTPPFKLGTFEHQGRTLLGLVLGDQTVIDVAAANAVLEEGHPTWPKLKPPSDMKDLIARYETDGLKERLHALARDGTAAGARARTTRGRPSGSGRPSPIRRPC